LCFIISIISEPVAPPRGKKKTTGNKLDGSPVVSGNQVRGQDHVTDHVISDKDHVTSGEDRVTFDKDHVTIEEDHEVTNKTSDKDLLTSDKDHVISDEDHVASNKDMAARLGHTLTDNTSHDKSPNHHGDVTDGGSNYDATKELDEILSKCDLVDGSHLSTSHSIGVTDTIETYPPQKISHEQPQESSNIHKKSNSLEVPLTSSASSVVNKSPSPGPMSDSVSVYCVCVCVCERVWLNINE